MMMMMMTNRFYCRKYCCITTTSASISILGKRPSRRRTSSKLMSITSFSVPVSSSSSIVRLLSPSSSHHRRLDQRKQYYYRHHHSSSAFQRTNPLYLNRILFDISEIDDANVNILPSSTPPSASNSDNIDINTNRHIDTIDHHDRDVLDDEILPPLATVTLPRDDYRTIHVAKILGLCNGDTVRAGVVRSAEDDDDNTNINNQNCHNYDIKNEGLVQDNERNNHHHHHLAGLITDDAMISWLPEGKNKKPQPTKNGEPPGSLRVSIPQPPKTILYNNENAAKTRIGNSLTSTTLSSCPVSLLLALPRPLQLGRLLPMITQLGIHHLILTSAKKVPKDYFGSHILRQPAILRNLLIEGLAQCGDVQLPKITIVKHSLKAFMEEELEMLFPVKEVARVVAHPTRISRSSGGGYDDGDAVVEDHVVSTTTTCSMRMSDVQFPNDIKRQLLIAIGPEGGWAEPNELDMFANMGFQEVTLGTRVLRSDVAVVSLLALAHEICARDRRHET